MLFRSIVHEALDRRVQLRMRQTFDLIDVVGCGQFAGAVSRKIANGIDIRQVARTQDLIQRSAVVVARKSRVWLKIYSRTDMNLINAVSDLRDRRIARQAPALLVEIDGRGNAGDGLMLESGRRSFAGGYRRR